MPSLTVSIGPVRNVDGGGSACVCQARRYRPAAGGTVGLGEGEGVGVSVGVGAAGELAAGVAVGEELTPQAVVSTASAKSAATLLIMAA
jgi:hypothetical protein